MKCKKELGDLEVNNDGTCPHEGCEGKFFAYSDGDFTVNEEKGKLVCGCGSDEFQGFMHMDMTKKAVNNYKCTGCGNIIGTEIYRDACDPMNEEY
jgi:hypothetical protein